MSEAHAEYRNRGMLDHFGADTEVGWPLRGSRPRGDDDIVEIVEHAQLELGPIIGHKRRRTSVHLGEEVEKVERERIVIVDEQRTNHGLPLPQINQRLGWKPVLSRQYAKQPGNSNKIRHTIPGPFTSPPL